jgi:hypothetical protein
LKRGRGLRRLSRAAALTWALALPALVSLRPAEETPAPLPRVRAAPPPTPAPRAAPAPEAESPPEPRAVATPPRAPSADERAEGEALLDAGGRFPALSFGYDDFPSFLAYARAMQRLGARFVVVSRRQIVGSVDLDTGSLGPPSLDGAFSPRARDHGGEPGLGVLADAARRRFGAESDLRMLVPRSVDAGLFGAIARLLAERGEDRDALREIRGRYERGPDGGVHLRVEAAVRRDGTAVPLDALIDLGGLASRRRA